MTHFLSRHWLRIIVYGGLAVAMALAWRGRNRLIRLYETGEFRSRSVADVLTFAEPKAKQRFEPVLRQAGLSFPPPELVLLAFKREAVLEVWTMKDEHPAYLASYPILRASGTLGPKRKRGDWQVPEGFYALPVLNPMSQFHLSIRVDYPNDEDRRVLGDGPLGDDIYIHGKSASIGCLAMGDPAIEEIFALAALVPEGRRRIVISPVDWRRDPQWSAPANAEPWLVDRYAKLRAEVLRFPVPR